MLYLLMCITFLAPMYFHLKIYIDTHQRYQLLLLLKSTTIRNGEEKDHKLFRLIK